MVELFLYLRQVCAAKKFLYMRLFIKNIDIFDMLWYNKIEYFSRGVNSHEKNRNILDTLLDFDTIDFLR